MSPSSASMFLSINSTASVFELVTCLLDVGQFETHDPSTAGVELAGADVLLRVHGVRVRQAGTPGVVVFPCHSGTSNRNRAVERGLG